MHALGTLAALAFLLSMAACGGGSGSDNGGGDSVGTCNFPSCVSTVIESCRPSGSCVSQSNATLTSEAYCFSNGVTAVSFDDSDNYGWVTTYKKNGAGCYSVIEGDFWSTISTFEIRDGSGAVLGTGTSNIETKVVKFACVGGPGVTLNSGCDLRSITTAPLYGANCKEGTCAP